eukprot:TRINITY_DN12129_c0_g1_i1.p1 TRINITY_DN12129_c0_g1~~TRINITY_DN12129_c0_g1_i1.p1  ORF type:complete len:116 (+),score=11.72 TRINITY_DN12129_c0_g1_i1:177-524(+)
MTCPSTLLAHLVSDKEKMCPPYFFSIYLNDLKSHISDKVEGLNNLKVEAEKLQMDAHDVDVLFQMCILLYADDTVLFAESPTSLQRAIDAMHEYCLKWDLRINVSKTKVMIFFLR